MTSSPFILIAEDDPDDQLLISEVLVEACPPDTQTHYVEDGVALIDFLHENLSASFRPNFVVLDLNMPRKDGRVALREIKADPGLMHLPVVVLTTSNTEEDVYYCQGLGVDGYFRKPSSMAELRSIFSRLCNKYIV